MHQRGEYLMFGGDESPLTLILAHGAGAPMTAPFMLSISREISAHGFRVVLFEFDYMKRIRAEKRRLPPDRAPKLLEKWKQVLGDFADGKVAIGGKSMGGRMASMIAAEDPSAAAALVCLGYPFHPPGRPENLRTGHLDQIQIPTLICQGERDPFGTRQEISAMTFPANFSFHWLADGDHGFKPRAASGLTEEQNIKNAADHAAAFLTTLV